MKPLSRGRDWWLSAGLVTGCLFAATACDTVALISFQNREFAGIESPGFTAPAGSCGGLEDGTATLRFVLMADDQTPIRPGDVVNKQAIPALTSAEVELEDSALFELPDVACSAGDCRLGEMTCGTAPGQQASQNRCFDTTSVSLAGDIQFESDVTTPQLFGVLFENAGSTEGWLPRDVGELYPDWDEDGTAEGQTDSGPLPARASDSASRRKAALTVLLTNWETAAEAALAENRTTQFGLWEFKGTVADDVVSLVDEATPGDTAWTSQYDIANRARENFTQVVGSRANVYQSALHVLDTAYAPTEYNGHEKTLVIFVDGPDDLRFPQYSANAVIQRATDLGVRIFIAHLDAAQEPTTQGGTPVHRDDPEYWSNTVEGEQIQSPCASDADCKNFESCVVPTSYSSSPNGAVEITPGGDMYCMPRRDENGRIGPIDEYARIACATDGGYIYVKDPAALRPRLDWLPFTMDGLWKTDVTIDDFANRTLPSGEAYKLQTTLRVTIAGRAQSIDFSQSGEAGTTEDASDNRSILFN